MLKDFKNLPTEIRDLFIQRGYDPKEIRETEDSVFRVYSAYGPGDFYMTKDGLIENSWAGFIGREDKVCYIEQMDPKQDFKVVYEDMI